MNEKEQRSAVTIKELPLSERPREKLLKNGAGALSNPELLAILIGTGARNASAVVLAGRILALGEEGLPSLAQCTPEELEGVEGIGKAKACQIIAALELGRRMATSPREKKVSAGDPASVAELFMENMRYMGREHFRILLLNSKNEIIAVEDASVGILNSSMAHPREIFRSAVKRSAASVIVVHNHPTGDPLPSGSDLAVTERLVEAGKLLGIEVLDHVIIGDGRFVSLREKGLM
ncbi:MAG: DNA repair protein RadC [Bacillota bacterium]|nr:DNA repair protein RadC [Bacillota bacterium]